GDRDQRRRSPFGLEPACGVGKQQRLAAELAESLDHDSHRVRVTALIVVAAALKQRHSLALDRSDHQTPGMPLDTRDGKTWNIKIGDRGRVSRFVGESPKT